MNRTEKSLHLARTDFYQSCELLPGVGFDTFYRYYVENEQLWSAGPVLLEDVLAEGNGSSLYHKACA